MSAQPRSAMRSASAGELPHRIITRSRYVCLQNRLDGLLDHLPTDIQVGDESNGSGPETRGMDPFFVQCLKDLTGLKMVSYIEEQDIRSYRADMFDPRYLTEGISEHTGMFMVLSQSVDMMFEGVNACSRKISGLPHPASHGFSDPSGFVDESRISE